MNQRMKVLLVEDDPDFVLLLSLSLNEACGSLLKFSLQCAETLDAGLALLAKEEFDIIILDLMLPDSQGLETLSRMKIKSQDIPLVVLTSLRDEGVGLEAVARGAQDFLVKGRLDVNILRHSLLFAIERSRFSSQLEAVIGQSPDGMAVVDKEGMVRYVNASAEALLGKAKGELIGKPLGLPLEKTKTTELLLPGAENEGVVEVRVTDVDWRKEPASLVCLRDITALRKLAKLRAEIHERQRMDRLKDELLSTVSHELRSPLTVITAAVANLRDGLAGPLTEAGRQMVAIAGKNLDRLTRIVTNVLDLSRLESGKALVNPLRLDLHAAVVEAVKNATLACPGACARPRYDLPPDLPPAFADPDMVQQVLHNLLDNALRYASSTVTVEACVRPEEIVISVCDDGPGVPEERAAELFGKFVQLQRPVSGAGYKGTGLGLAICHEILRLNGGRIWVEPGHGGLFRFALPRYSRYSQEIRHEHSHAGPAR
jgi:signal transduction histidine kinase